MTTDADLAFETACLMPLGGAETTSGYKGFGLGAMVEVLCGISAGLKKYIFYIVGTYNTITIRSTLTIFVEVCTLC